MITTNPTNKDLEIGYLQHGTGTNGPFRTESVHIKHEYADNYKAWFEGRWRVIHHTPKTANGYHIIFHGERIPLTGWSM